MSYVTGNFNLVSQTIEGTAGTKIWRYTGTDAVATVLGAGYVSDATKKGVSAGDTVIYDKTDTVSTYSLKVSAIASGAGTLKGSDALSSDSFGAFGTPPIAQPTQAAQAAVPQGASGLGNAAAALTHYTSTQTPSSVATITTAEQSITVTGVLATDLVIVNKPTSQAGLGLVKGRVSAANTVKLSFLNATAGTLTPTGSEAYVVTTLPANLQTTATISPAAVAANTIVEQTFTVTGLDTGMTVEVNKPTLQPGLAVLSSRVSAKNTLALTFANTTAGTLTPTASEVYLVSGFNALVAASQTILFGIGSGTLALVAANSSAEQSLTEAGILATDTMIGIQKPTTQPGILVGAGRISGAATAKVTLGNLTAGNLTPTASEVYNVAVFRQSPGAPVSLFTSLSLVPSSVAANTTAEQTFTVTGIVSGQPIAAAPNFNLAATPGIGIAGVRASATNTLAVTFVNLTGGAIVPPAGTWTVAQFNTTTPTAGNFVQVLVGPLQTVGVSLLNALRSALTNLGLIAGA